MDLPVYGKIDDTTSILSQVQLRDSFEFIIRVRPNVFHLYIILCTDVLIIYRCFRNLAMGIGIQNFPEGLAVSLPLQAAGCSKWKSFW